MMMVHLDQGSIRGRFGWGGRHVVVVVVVGIEKENATQFNRVIIPTFFWLKSCHNKELSSTRWSTKYPVGLSAGLLVWNKVCSERHGTAGVTGLDSSSARVIVEVAVQDLLLFLWSLQPYSIRPPTFIAWIPVTALVPYDHHHFCPLLSLRGRYFSFWTAGWSNSLCDSSETDRGRTTLAIKKSRIRRTHDSLCGYI